MGQTQRNHCIQPLGIKMAWEGRVPAFCGEFWWILLLHLVVMATLVFSKASSWTL